MTRLLHRVVAALVTGTALAASAHERTLGVDAASIGTEPKDGFVHDAQPPASTSLLRPSPRLTPTLTPTLARTPSPPSPAVQDVLRRINSYRAAGASCGSRRFKPAAPVAWNVQLEQAAQKHARDMAARRTMSHTGGDGSNIGDRVGREAYAWSALGENVSAGYSSVPDALAGWMRSPGHCANLMSTSFREVGVGAAHVPGDAYGWYRAMVLGSPGR